MGGIIRLSPFTKKTGSEGKTLPREAIKLYFTSRQTKHEAIRNITEFANIEYL